MMQAGTGRSGKQQHQQNSPNLGTTFQPSPVSYFLVEGRWSRKTVFAINLIEVFVLQEIKSGNQQEGLWTSLARSPRVPPCPVHAWEMTLAICGAKNKQFDSGGILLMQRESSAKRPLLSLDAIWRHPNVRPPSVCSP